MAQKRIVMLTEHFSLNEAPRIALAAQGIDRPRSRGAVAKALAAELHTMAA